MTEKKVWVEPELLVLVRNKPEEAMLVTCKGIPMPGGSGSSVDNCMEPCGIPCGILGNS